MDSFSNLNQNSQTLITYFDQKTGTTQTIPKSEINGIIETNTSVFNNINILAAASGCFVSWDQTLGIWSIVLNEPTDSVKSFDDSNIIGNIIIGTNPLSDLYNKGTIEYPNTDAQDTLDYVDLTLPESQRYQNEILNVLELQFSCINNPIHAQLILNKEIKQNRLDKVIEFNTDYTSNGLKAGDVITVTSQMYGFNNKEFRIISIEESDGDDGSLTYKITALEYDESIYDTTGLVKEERSKRTGIVPRIQNQAIEDADNQNLSNQLVDISEGGGLGGFLDNLLGFAAGELGNMLDEFLSGNLGGTPSEIDPNLANQASQYYGETSQCGSGAIAVGQIEVPNVVPSEVGRDYLQDCSITVPNINMFPKYYITDRSGTEYLLVYNLLDGVNNSQIEANDFTTDPNGDRTGTGENYTVTWNDYEFLNSNLATPNTVFYHTYSTFGFGRTFEGGRREINTQTNNSYQYVPLAFKGTVDAINNILQGKGITIERESPYGSVGSITMTIYKDGVIYSELTVNIDTTLPNGGQLENIVEQTDPRP